MKPFNHKQWSYNVFFFLFLQFKLSGFKVFQKRGWSIFVIFYQGNERIAALREELQAKETEARGLELMIQRFNALNSSIHQETQENMNQQEILNQSLVITITSMVQLSNAVTYPKEGTFFIFLCFLSINVQVSARQKDILTSNLY